MKSKLKQRDIVVLHLNETKGEWVPVYALTKTQTKFGWLGSQGDRRAAEVMESVRETGFWEIGGARYKLERKQEGQYAYLRVIDLEEALKPVEPEKVYRYRVLTDEGAVKLYTVKQSRMSEFRRLYPKAERLLSPQEREQMKKESKEAERFFDSYPCGCGRCKANREKGLKSIH